MSTSNADCLLDTLIGIEAIVQRALQDHEDNILTPELAVVLHATRAARELCENLPSAGDEDDENTGDSKPPKLSVVEP